MVRFCLNSIGRKGYFGQTDTLLAVLEKYRQQLYKSILRVRVNGKRKDLIYEIGVYHNYQLVFQTELRIPLGYEKKTGQAIALPLKQFGLLRVFSSVYLLAKRYQI